MLRHWRAVLVLFVAVEVLTGTIAYGTPTWNFTHTEVLRGWDCVAYVCTMMAIGFMFMTGTVAIIVRLLDDRRS